MDRQDRNLKNHLWKKFREPIDFFFAAKDGHFAEKDEEGRANLEKKQALIEELKAYELDADPKKSD